MATVKLTMRRRTDTGKQGSKRIRKAGDVPAVVYGEKLETVPVTIEANALRTALSTPAGRNVIIQLGLEGEDSSTRAVIRDMERDAVTREILHVDLQRISENKPVVMHDVRLMAVSASTGRLEWVVSEPDPTALERYRRGRVAHAAAESRRSLFPGTFDLYELRVVGQTLSATEKRSGATWQVVVPSSGRQFSSRSPGAKGAS